MKRIFGLHKDHIKDFLSEISLKYKDYRHFLDIGCGDGTLTILFDNFGRIVCGVDCRNCLSNAAKDRISFKQEDFLRTKLPYENNFFDMAFSFDVIEHLPDPNIMLGQVRRVLKKEGVFIISTPNRFRLLGFPLVLFGLRKFPYYPDNRVSISYDCYSAHITEYTIAGLRRLMENNGFKIVKIHKLFYGPTGKLGLRSLFSLPFFHNIVLECVPV